jgi:electron transport complex protein RnfB
MACTLAPAPLLARIDEAACIGCTLCIAACPVDAIVGAAKLMHTVLVERCTGCELCLPPCPVDCIALVPRSRPWTAADADRARANEGMRAGRLARRGGRVEAPAHMPLETTPAERQAAVAAALERARERRAARR